jgi:hypothetical protein
VPTRELSAFGDQGTAPAARGDVGTRPRAWADVATAPAVFGAAGGAGDMAENVNLGCFAGEDVVISFTVRRSGVAIDITGWAVTFRLLTSAGLEVAEKTVGSGVTLTDPEAGVLTVTLASADTDQAAGIYSHTLARTDSGGKTVLAYGQFGIAATLALD